MYWLPSFFILDLLAPMQFRRIFRIFCFFGDNLSFETFFSESLVTVYLPHYRLHSPYYLERRGRLCLSSLQHYSNLLSYP